MVTKRNYKSKKGVAALITIVVISASILTMALTSSLLGLGELELGFTSSKGAEALSVVDSCVEEAIIRLERDSGYTGGTLNLGNGSCTTSIVANVNDRIITVVGNVGEYYKKVEVDTTLSSGKININSWQELSN